MPQGRAPILVVEDNDDTSEALRLMLALRGYETVHASDGLDALGQLRAGLRPSLIVLDWMMPNVDGAGFLANVAANPGLARIPVIIYSAVTKHILADDVLATVPKAQDPDVLLAAIASVCPPARNR